MEKVVYLEPKPSQIYIVIASYRVTASAIQTQTELLITASEEASKL